MTLTTHTVPLQTKSFGTKSGEDGVDDGNFYLSGYAAIFGNEDRDGDIIEKGAFVESLAGEPGMPLLLLNHQMRELPVGTIETCYEDEKGLYFEAKLPKDDDFVRGRLAPQLRAGSLKGVSFGFQTEESEPIKGKSGRRITKLKCYEISPVNLPANPKTSYGGMKSATLNDLLPVSDKKAAGWDATAALERVKAFTDCGSTPSDAYKNAFLFADETAPDDWSSYKFLIADVEGDCLKAQTTALFNASASIVGHRDGGNIGSDMKATIKPVLDAYYDVMGLKSPFVGMSSLEYDQLDASAREVRLRAIGLTPGLAKSLSGSREGNRTRRDGGSELNQDVKSLIEEVRILTEGLSNERRNT